MTPCMGMIRLSWQDPLGKSVVMRHHGFRLRIGSWMMELWFTYPNKKVKRDG